jgi:hypothetical protein
MTTHHDTQKDRHRPDKQAAAIARLREKGLGLAPHVEGGKIVGSKRSGKQPAGKGGSVAVSVPQVPSDTIPRPAKTGGLASAIPGSVFELLIPAPAEFLNANRDKSLHWAPKADRVRAWRAAAAREAILTGLPKGLPRVQIDAYLIKPRANRFDPANWAPTAKACVDGMVDAGVTEDDDRHHVAGPFMHDGGKGEPALRVVVTVLTPS